MKAFGRFIVVAHAVGPNGAVSHIATIDGRNLKHAGKRFAKDFRRAFPDERLVEFFGREIAPGFEIAESEAIVQMFEEVLGLPIPAEAISRAFRP